VASYLLLLAPSANHLYADGAPRLGAAELALTCADVGTVEAIELAGVDYLSFTAPDDDAILEAVAGLSGRLALFAVDGELLRPVELPVTDWLSDDLVTIPKYTGKTNEQFPRLLMNLTLAQVRRPGEIRSVLDPLAGRGTTLLTCWLMGHHAYGVEGDAKAIEAMAAHVKTWLRRKRLKHQAMTTPVRREGRMLGKRFDATLRLADRPELKLGCFTGDARDSASLWGRKRFDAIVTDAPYGVVHGSARRGGNPQHRDRGPAALLDEAIGVWASQLHPGGALGLSWNTHTLAREDLVEMIETAGLVVNNEGAWLDFSHRVDASIQRDLVVALRPED